MRPMTRAWLLAAAAAALLAAGGGSDPYVPGSGSPSGAPTTKGTFSAVVVFGDSLSDGGTYSPVFSLAGNGAKHTQAPVPPCRAAVPIEPLRPL